jgi:hypothetical protein
LQLDVVELYVPVVDVSIPVVEFSNPVVVLSPFVVQQYSVEPSTYFPSDLNDPEIW